jgi:hypothetical protein
MARLRCEIEVAPDAELIALLDELARYPRVNEVTVTRRRRRASC